MVSWSLFPFHLELEKLSAGSYGTGLGWASSCSNDSHDMTFMFMNGYGDKTDKNNGTSGLFKGIERKKCTNFMISPWGVHEFCRASMNRMND